jgi:hypothetical protein
MLITNSTSGSSARKNHRMRVMEQALARADLDGVPKAAADFGIAEAILDSVRENARLAHEVVALLHSPALSFAQRFTKQVKSKD